LDFEAVGNIAFLGSPEFSDEFLVLWLRHVEFSGLVVLKLRVLLHLFGNSLASEQPDSLNFEVGLLAEDGVDGEGVLSEVVDSLEEALHEVDGLVEDLALTGVFLVVQVVDGVAFRVEVLEELVDGGTLLVGVVDEESLEFEEVELGRREHVEGVDVLLLGCLFFLLGSRLSDFSLALNLDDGLDNLLSHLDVSESLDNLRNLSNSLEPSSYVGHTLLESSI